MSTDVIMPQMGESIAEGTITKWLKKPGDAVKRDEPLFEISTDKVDAEIPSQAAGVLAEILVQEGQTVGINTVVGRIGAGEPCYVAKPACTERFADFADYEEYLRAQLSSVAANGADPRRRFRYEVTSGLTRS